MSTVPDDFVFCLEPQPGDSPAHTEPLQPGLRIIHLRLKGDKAEAKSLLFTLRCFTKSNANPTLRKVSHFTKKERQHFLLWGISEEVRLFVEGYNSVSGKRVLWLLSEIPPTPLPCFGAWD